MPQRQASPDRVASHRAVAGAADRAEAAIWAHRRLEEADFHRLIQRQLPAAEQRARSAQLGQRLRAHGVGEALAVVADRA